MNLLFATLLYCGIVAGLLICIEGIDGAGKCTQSDMLKKKLVAEGTDAVIFSYPNYDTAYGKILREFLDKKFELSAVEQFLLYLIDMERDRKEVQSKLASGRCVIMDRYFLSTIAYQSAGGFEFNKAVDIENVVSLPKPNIIFYLDVSVKTAIDRKMKQKGKLDRNEAAGAYLEKVRLAYERMYKEGVGNSKWIKIDGDGSASEIHEFIYSAVKKMMGKK